MTHPLLNPDSSSHYNMVDGVEAIERLEAMYTNEELRAWAKITAMKYRLRVGHKDEPSKEVAKIKTYEDYYKYLETLPDDGHTLHEKQGKLWTDEEYEVMASSFEKADLIKEFIFEMFGENIEVIKLDKRV